MLCAERVESKPGRLDSAPVVRLTGRAYSASRLRVFSESMCIRGPFAFHAFSRLAPLPHSIRIATNIMLVSEQLNVVP